MQKHWSVMICSRNRRHVSRSWMRWTLNQSLEPLRWWSSVKLCTTDWATKHSRTMEKLCLRKPVRMEGASLQRKSKQWMSLLTWQPVSSGPSTLGFSPTICGVAWSTREEHSHWDSWCWRYVLFLVHLSGAEHVICCTHVQTWVTVCHWLKIKCLCARSYQPHSIHVCTWAFLSTFVSLFLIFNLINLSGHVADQQTLRRSTEWGVWLCGQNNLFYRLWSRRDRQFRLLRDLYSDLPEWIRRRRHGTVVLVRCGTRRWAYQKSAIFTTVHSGARRISELETNLHSHEESLLPALSFFHTNKYGETRVRTKFEFGSKKDIKSRPGKRANQNSPWKTKRANSC